jgi:hypothetical protein
MLKHLKLKLPWRVRCWIRNTLAKWPPVPNNSHQQMVSSLRRQIQEQEQRRQREQEELRADLDRVLPKLVGLSLDKSHFPDDRYRLILDMDPFLIRTAFQFGNDRRMIRYFAEHVGHMVERELFTANMHRFADESFRGRNRS